MLINLTELFSVEGKKRLYVRYRHEPDFAPARMPYDIVFTQSWYNYMSENLGDGSFFSLAVQNLTLQMPCDRCLEPVDIPFNLEFDEELDMSKTESERTEDLDEQPYVSGYNLDVDRLAQ